MNYSNHSLRTDLQEWKNRLYRASYDQFGHQLRYFFNNLDTNVQLHGLIIEAIQKTNYKDEFFREFTDNRLRLEIEFSTEVEQISFCYQFLKYMIKIAESHNLHRLIIFQARDFDETKSRLIENYISPIIYYLHDRLDKSNSTIFLLEKYKRRTEWFTKKDLFEKYKNAKKNYEQIFEDDLRLFLFDQGIDYPFSTPSSSSGRADIVGEIDTDDPLVIEIKIFDREKTYGKNRIKEGFSQIVKYANDYNKDVGYLVIYNLDKAIINIKTSDSVNIFPPTVKFNNKTFYLIIVNASVQDSASKTGQIEEIEINETELTK